MKRLALVLALIPLAAACARGPFDDVDITAVELRWAPRLEFLKARVGMSFLEVRFEFANKGSAPLTLKALDFSLRDTAGQLYPYSAQVLNLGQPRGVAEARIEAGQRVSGSVVFQVPERAVPADLIYRQDVGSGLAISLKASR